MKTIGFREFLANELHDAQMRQEFIIACYEQDGVDGLEMAFREIARADTHFAAQEQALATNNPLPLTSLRALLNQIGLDLNIVPLRVPDTRLVPV